MATDQKKVQTMVNIVGQQAQIIRNAVTSMEAVRLTFNAINPVVTGTPLQGKKAAVSAAIDALRTAADDIALTDMIDAIVPSHRNGAI